MLVGAVLGLLSLLIPPFRREAWRREWRAELIHLERTLERRGTGRLRRRFTVTVHTLDALEDAMGMWTRGGGSSSLGQDVRFALRSLGRSPTFTVVAVLTLTLGIGANAAIFSVVRSAVLRPLPYAEPEALVDVRLSFRNLESGHERRIPASEPEFLELSEAGLGLELAGYWTGDVNLGGGAEPERVPVAGVSANLLDVLGVEPALGRAFARHEDRPGQDAVAILSHGLWARTFGSDPAVVGRDVTLDGRAVTVVGVLPPSFVFPGADADVLQPNTIDRASPAGRSSHYVSMLGRMGAGATVAETQARIDALLTRWEGDFPGRHGLTPGHPITLVPLHEAIVGDTRASLTLLLGVVVVVLLIASANVASLMLVRVEHRQRETGVRLALGAGTRGVVTPFLVEAALLSAAGALLGLGLARGAVAAVERFGPPALTRLGGVQVDLPVLLFTVGAAVATALLFGVGPALLAARGDARERLVDGDRGSSGGARRGLVRSGVVVGQVALAVMLVVAAGVLLQSLDRLLSVDPGFDPSGVVTMEIALSSSQYPDPSEAAAFHVRLAEELAAQPGVVASGAIRSLPFARTPGIESMALMGVARDPDEDWHWNAQFQVVSPGTFEALGVPLLRGRSFDATDIDGAPAVAVVNRSMADGFAWPNGDPIGARIKLGHPEGPNPEMTVVGVVGDMRQGGFDEAVAPQLFVPRGQAGVIYGGFAARFATVVVRSELPPLQAMTGAREAIRRIDPGLPVANARTLEGVLDRSVASRRFLTALVGAFSLLALALGAIGVAGLVSYGVERRTRELGLRIALGADRAGILRLVLDRALLLVITGTAVGLGGAWLASGVLEGQLYEVSARDPATYALAPFVLVSVALLAALLPAARATRVDPTTAMRSE